MIITTYFFGAIKKEKLSCCRVEFSAQLCSLFTDPVQVASGLGKGRSGQLQLSSGVGSGTGVL